MSEAERIKAIEADITTLALDAIVNAANAPLLPGGGVDGAIRRAAGPAIDEDLRAIGHCEPGAAVLTRGHRLNARYVIHTVAPIWSRSADQATQKRLLASCYASALTLAGENDVRSIAFPAIGTGAYGWPADQAASIALDAVLRHLRNGGTQERVIFCCFSRADRDRYAALLEALPK